LLRGGIAVIIYKRNIKIIKKNWEREVLVLRVLSSKYRRAKNQSENLKIKEDQSVSNAVYFIVLQAQHMGLSTD